MTEGLVHIYYGDGKGKTTAAIGLGVRACGANKRCLFVQFLKSDNSSERLALTSLPNFDMLEIPKNIPFVWNMTDGEKEQYKLLYSELFSTAISKVQSDRYSLLILDEIFAAISCDFVSTETLLNFLKVKPKSLEVVLTGHNPSPEIFAFADYISEIKKVRHPFDKGVSGRLGIEY